jgi:DNA polymerase
VIDALLDQVRQVGANLELDGADLYIDGLEAPPAELVQLLRAHKAELLVELTRVRLDFETASRIDIKDVGASAYAEHPSTRVLLLSYCVGDGPVRVWRPEQPMPEDLRAALARGGPVVAHNASFDQAVWQAHTVQLGWPELPWERWSCTSIRSRLMRLPAGLAEVAGVLELPVQKDQAGKKMMKQLAKTAYRGGYEPTNAELDRLADYCRIDTEVLHQLDRMLPEPDTATRELIDLDFAMNRRGFPVDLDLVRKLIRVRDAENRRLIARVNEVTDGAITKPTQAKRIMQLLAEHEGELENLQHDTLERWIEEHPDADHLAAQVIRIRYEFAHSSDAKLQRFITEAATTGLVRDGFHFFGAHTGRWSGRNVQPQNMPRTSLEDTEATLRRLSAAAEGDDPAQVPTMVPRMPRYRSRRRSPVACAAVSKRRKGRCSSASISRRSKRGCWPGWRMSHTGLRSSPIPTPRRTSTP